PAHSQSNGAVERVNREVKRHLYAILHDILEKEDWHLALPVVMNIINNTPHTVTGNKPYDVLFGIRETIDLSKDWSEERKTSFQQLPDNHKSVDIYVKGITDNIKEVVESSKKHLEIEKVATEAPLIDS
ncbi:hypothetical protein ADUPG1_003808, partial [Aduncisulcus paluster]